MTKKKYQEENFSRNKAKRSERWVKWYGIRMLVEGNDRYIGTRQVFCWLRQQQSGIGVWQVHDRRSGILLGYSDKNEHQAVENAKKRLLRDAECRAEIDSAADVETLPTGSVIDDGTDRTSEKS